MLTLVLLVVLHTACGESVVTCGNAATCGECLSESYRSASCGWCSASVGSVSGYCSQSVHCPSETTWSQFTCKDTRRRQETLLSNVVFGLTVLNDEIRDHVAVKLAEDLEEIFGWLRDKDFWILYVSAGQPNATIQWEVSLGWNSVVSFNKFAEEYAKKDASRFRNEGHVTPSINLQAPLETNNVTVWLAECAGGAWVLLHEECPNCNIPSSHCYKPPVWRALQGHGPRAAVVLLGIIALCVVSVFVILYRRRAKKRRDARKQVEFAVIGEATDHETFQNHSDDEKFDDIEDYANYATGRPVKVGGVFDEEEVQFQTY